MIYDCKSCVDAIVDYLYDELSCEDRSAFEDHLGECEACSEELQSLAATRLVMSKITDERIDRDDTYVLQVAARESQRDKNRKLETGFLGRIARALSGRPALIALPVAGLALMLVIGISLNEELSGIFETRESASAPHLLSSQDDRAEILGFKESQGVFGSIDESEKVSRAISADEDALLFDHSSEVPPPTLPAAVEGLRAEIAGDITAKPIDEVSESSEVIADPEQLSGPSRIGVRGRSVGPASATAPARAARRAKRSVPSTVDDSPEKGKTPAPKEEELAPDQPGDIGALGIGGIGSEGVSSPPALSRRSHRPAPAPGQSRSSRDSPIVDMASAKSLFERGDCGAFLKYTTGLLSSGVFSSDEDKAEIHALRARCFQSLGREDAAAWSWEMVLKISPTGAFVDEARSALESN